MQEKYKDKGVVLVALTDERLQTVSRLLTASKVNYLVGLESSRTRNAYGARGLPAVYVIDPDGKVAFWGSSAKAAEATIDKLLTEKPPKVAKSVATRHADERIARADTLLKEKKQVEALREYQKIVADFGDAPIAIQAAKHIEALKADPKLAEMIEKAEAAARQAARCDKLLHLARALANAGHPGQAIHYYDEVAKNCAATKFADLAAGERASLNKAGASMGGNSP
jgi:tetratricopeptide (TPR) repeat protein